MRSKTILMATVLFFATVSLRVQAAEPRHFSFAYDQPHTTAYGIAADTFVNKLQELSKGTMVIDQFPGAQLGQEPQVLQKIADRRRRLRDHLDGQFGDCPAGSRNIFDPLRVSLGGSSEKALADPTVVAAFKEMMNSKVEGAHTLALGTMGFRESTASARSIIWPI